MYAIIVDGGRQLKVEVGKEIMIDYRGELEPGTSLEFPQVLAVSSDDSVKIGQPIIEGAKVVASVVSEKKGPKLTICKFRRRKNSRRRTGHRQIHTLVKIDEIIPG
ncbi:MAG: 50S ribosomal protein L21 [Thermoguttaceae bacterium]